VQFEADTVTIALADGSQKRYPNDGAFVLIGADPPIQWLEKMGIRFVERPHQYQLGKTDDIVRRYVRANECPEDAARAAAQILGGSTGVMPDIVAAAAAPPQMPLGEPVSGPRKWLRSATSIFSTKEHGGTRVGPAPTKPDDRRAQLKTEGKGKKFDAPVPLSEFAKRNKTQGPQATGGTNVHHQHTGHGRRDQLSAGERTRILRMLRDEGGRLADEDSQVYIGAAPALKDYDFDFDDGPAAVSAPPSPRADVPAKPAIVVGMQQAQSRKKKASLPPPPPPSRDGGGPPPPPTASFRGGAKGGPPPRPPTRSQAQQPPPKRAVPPPFSDEPTRQVDDEILTALRSGQVVRPTPPPPQPMFNDEPTRMAPPMPQDLNNLGTYDDAAFAEVTNRDRQQPKFPQNAPATDPQLPGFEHYPEEATNIASIDGIAAMERARHNGNNDERTRAVNIRNDPSISDIDWDLD
jgi:hypothetical protein